MATQCHMARYLIGPNETLSGSISIPYSRSRLLVHPPPPHSIKGLIDHNADSQYNHAWSVSVNKSITPSLNWSFSICQLALFAACKVIFLFRNWRFLVYARLILLHEVQLRSILNHCSHMSSGLSSTSSYLPDPVQPKIIRLLSDSPSISSLQSLAHYRVVASLSFIYFWYFGCYSSKLVWPVQLHLSFIAVLPSKCPFVGRPPLSVFFLFTCNLSLFNSEIIKLDLMRKSVHNSMLYNALWLRRFTSYTTCNIWCVWKTSNRIHSKANVDSTQGRQLILGCS